MKYGNFVGKGWMRFADDEARQIVETLRKNVESVFEDGFFKEPVIERVGDDMEECTYAVISLRITLPLATPFSGRNRFGDTIRDASSVNFYVTKHKGAYLSVKKNFSAPCSEEEKDYENCPEFSYGCKMSVSGYERPYRHSKWDYIKVRDSYTYGTEASDLEYGKNALRYMKSKITNR